MTQSAKSRSSLSELTAYISLPAWVRTAEWELVTLPEQGASELPGRTDYVVLIALLRGEEPGSQQVKIDLPKMVGATAVQPEFARAWLPSDSSVKLKKLGLGAFEIYDAKMWVRRTAKRSIAFDADGGVLLYVEYLSP